MLAYQTFASLHAIAGAVALASFWVAALTTKGGRMHRRAGKVHVLSIVSVIATAVPLVLAFLARSTAFGLFLTYLVVLVGTSAWCGWHSVRDKRDWPRYTGARFKALMWLNLVVGIAIIGVGVFYMPTLKIPTVVIGLLGIASFVRMYAFARREPSDPRWWFNEHLSSMIASGAGGHVAFLFFGLPKILPGVAGTAAQNFAWLAPIVAAGIARAYLARKYLRRATPAV